MIHGCGPAVWNLKTPDGPKSIRVSRPLCTNSVVIIRDAILDGVGVGWLPDYVIGEELRQGRLTQLLPEAKLPKVRVFGIMQKQAHQNAAVRAVFNVLGSALRSKAE